MRAENPVWRLFGGILLTRRGVIWRTRSTRACALRRVGLCSRRHMHGGGERLRLCIWLINEVPWRPHGPFPAPTTASCRTCDKKARRCVGLRAKWRTQFPGLRGVRVTFRVAPATKTRRCVGLRARRSTRFPGLRRVRVTFRVAPATENAPLRGAPGQVEDSIPRAPPGPCRVSCRTCDKKRAVALGSGPGGALDSQGSAGYVSRFVSHLRQKTRRCVGLRARRSTRFPGLRRVRVRFHVAPATKNAPLRWAPGQAEHSIPRAPPGPCPVSCRTCDKERAVALASGPGGTSIPRAPPGTCHVSCRTCDTKTANRRRQAPPEDRAAGLGSEFRETRRCAMDEA